MRIHRRPLALRCAGVFVEVSAPRAAGDELDDRDLAAHRDDDDDPVTLELTDSDSRTGAASRRPPRHHLAVVACSKIDTQTAQTRHTFPSSVRVMEEARRVIERLERIDALDRATASPAELLGSFGGSSTTPRPGCASKEVMRPTRR